MADQSVLLTQFVLLGAQVALLLLGARIVLALLLVALACAARSGPVASGLARCALQASPRFLRGALQAALGTGLVVGLACAPASAAPDPASVPLLDRGSTTSPVVSELAPAPRALGSRVDRTTARYRVRSGDSLWSIAASTIGAGAPSREVARAWPRWYAVNGSTIGPDPAALHVGQRLVVPPRWRPARSLERSAPLPNPPELTAPATEDGS